MEIFFIRTFLSFERICAQRRFVYTIETVRCPTTYAADGCWRRIAFSSVNAQEQG